MINRAIHFAGVAAVLVLSIVGVSRPLFAGYAVSNGNDASVVYSGTEYTKIPKFISQKQALETQEKTGAMVRVAYNLSLGQDLTLAQLPTNDYYYYNTYTNIISVAQNSQDSIDLSQFKPQVFYAVAGESLSATLERWAKRNEMQLNFLPDTDYIIQYAYTFHGELTAPDGPLNALLQSFMQGPNAMKATVMKNGVIVISQNSYVPAPVVGV